MDLNTNENENKKEEFTEKSEQPNNNQFENPLPGEAIPREYFYNDDFDESPYHSNKSCLQRYFSKIQSGSLRGSIISMASIVFGIAGLAYPVGFANIGLIPGIILFAIISLFNYLSLYAIIFTARKEKINHYGMLIQKVLGNTMALISDINNIIFCVGVAMSYEFTIQSFFQGTCSKFFPDLTSVQKLNIKRIQMTVSALCIMLPLCLLRNISTLQYASMVGSLALIYSCFLIVGQSYFYYEHETHDHGKTIPLFKPLSLKIFHSFSVFLFGYAQHNGVLPVFDELARPSGRRTKTVLNRAFLLEVILFFSIGLGGFFSLQDPTPSIFLNRKDLEYKSMDKDYFVIIAQSLFFITLHCTVAINNNILRNSFKSLIFKGKEITKKIDFLIVFTLLVATNIVTYFIADVMDIISIVGSICSVIVCLVSPIMCWVYSNGKPLTSFTNIVVIIILSIFVIIGLCCVAYSIYEQIIRE